MKRYRFIFLLVIFTLAIFGCGDGSSSHRKGGNGGGGNNAVVYDDTTPLCFNSSGSTSVSIKINGTLGGNIPALEYSKDGQNWTPIVLENGETVEVTALSDGEKVYLRAQNTNNSFSEDVFNFIQFIFTGDGSTIAASGNIMSLLDKTLNSTEIPCDGCFCYLFKNCATLTRAPALPATILTSSCYAYMFYGCTSLVTAPALPAETLASSCYQNMFEGCTSLETAPDLPATTLASSCYQNMFSGCTSLVTAPDLPVTELVMSCYAGMFSGCTNLVTAPKLPATVLANYCYKAMFAVCTSLVNAPALPAETLATDCYYQMFLNCTNLNYLKVSFKTWGTQTYYWVQNVSATGTFICPAALDEDFDCHKIPLGWNVENP